MQYDGLVWVFVLLVLLVVLVVGCIFFECIWFFGWLCGICGLVFVVVVVLLLVFVWDLCSYLLFKFEQLMVILSFQVEGLQCYWVLIQEGVNECSVVLDGEFW